MAQPIRPVSSADPIWVRALYGYNGTDSSSLSFRQGDVIEVLSTLESGWWDGVVLQSGTRGWFPSNFVEKIGEDEAMLAAGRGGDSRRGSVASSASRQLSQSYEDGEFAAGLVSGFGTFNLGGSLSRDPTLQDFMDGGELDLTSFSTGGDIFGEIAAAAAQNDLHIAPPSSAMSRNPSAASFPSSVSGPGPSSPALSSNPLPTMDDGEAGGINEEEDFWVPKMTHTGQLFYYNTSSGETSRDMPIDGRGDGVRIDPGEYALDHAETAARRQSLVAASSGATRRASTIGGGTEGDLTSEWSERETEDGRGVYYVNLRTGEQRWEDPASAGNAARRSSVRPRAPAADAASLLSSWTERPPQAHANGVAAGASARDAGTGEGDKRASVQSQDSALDNGLTDLEKGAGHAELAAPDYASPRKASAATAELLGSPPPPLVADLEEVASRALQQLVSSVGLAGAVAAAGRDRAAERARLVEVGNDVVHAVRVVLHSTGALDHATLAAMLATGFTPVNEIAVPFTQSRSLPPAAQAELRPFSRRLTSTLSKLSFSLRAMWGLLETTEEDLHVQEDDTPADSEEVLRREQARQQTIAERKAVRDVRFEHETKLRSEILQGAQDVSDQVETFLHQYQRVALSLPAGSTGPNDAVRAVKPLQGSLRTEAGALLLPGGGFGGNWRGNGFVSLPTPHNSARLSVSSARGDKMLAYAWPSKPLAKGVVDALRREADGVSAAIEELRERSGHRLEDVLDPIAALQRQLAVFLGAVEDVDIAAKVDFQLPPASATRPASAETGTSGETSATRTYKASVREAKPLLSELEARKQALYDLAPRLLLALQAVAAPRPASAAPTAGQPHSNAPLSHLSPPSCTRHTQPVSFAVTTILDDLSSVLPALLSTFDSLVSVAEAQATAPGHLRSTSRSFRASMFGSSVVDSNGTATSARFSREPESTAPSTANSVRDSVDSDFFFSGAGPDQRQAFPATISTSSLTHSGSQGGTVRSQVSTSSSGTRAGLPFGTAPSSAVNSSVEVLRSNAPSGLPPGWDGSRRGSVATNMTGSSGGPVAPVDFGQPQATMSPSRSSSKNIQKLLGEVPIEAKQQPGGQDRRPWYLERDWADDELSFTMENTIRGGTLRGLVIAATSHEGRVDSSYLSAFLMTYRTFCTSHQLLDELINRYLAPEPEELSGDEYKEWEVKKQRPVRARVTNLLKAWVREYMDNEDLDRNLLERIREFAVNTMLEKGQSLQICKSVDERLQGAARRPVGNLAPGPLPPPILPRNLKKFKLTDLEPLELARQLTIMDGRLFQRITSQECLGKAWPKQFGSEAPNISAMIDMSNAVTRWVTESILSQDDLKKRASVIKHFVAIAERCLSLNNFSTLIHIIAGLNSTPIHRLRRTWEAVSQKAMISLGMLNNIMRPDKNYKEYRDILRKSAPPCVPFLGVYLTDWTFIGDGNPDMLRERPHQINFHKRQKASELILMIKLHQATTYNLQAVPPIAKHLQDRLFPRSIDPDKEDQRLYEISLALEPRERDDEKIARLLSESGFL
ncbi:uncharacterized protein JCM10292_003626 [Rhodotorula paludigena]|uniref:uncharacterized protein n=1 Tax=Rhodotorula paludigena TaxID=86838 RepID=UPI003171304F